MRITVLQIFFWIYTVPILTHAQIYALNDQEMSDIHGQALIQFQHSTDTSATNQNEIDFLSLTAVADISINANIKRLQLGCGGIKGANGCDIDIENLAISGLNDSRDQDGNPLFSKGRPATSATIRNPFLEFAIQDAKQISTRKIVGFRVGAAQIIGLLSLGSANTADPSDGLKQFSGFMQLAQTTGNVMTKPTKFADSTDEELKPPARITTFVGDTTFRSDSTSPDNTGITVPSAPASFTVPQTVIRGSRMSSITINNISAFSALIPLAAGSGIAGVDDAIFANDQLKSVFTTCLVIVCDAKFKMANGSDMRNLHINVSSLTQSLNAIHNIPLQQGGAYLSLQSENLKWPNTHVDDIAQQGWWMSFQQPIQLGKLNVIGEVDISAVLPQVANLVSQFLSDNPVDPAETTLNPLFNLPTSAKLNIDLGTYTINNPVQLQLGSQRYKNQEVVANCYGNLSIC